MILSPSIDCTHDDLMCVVGSEAVFAPDCDANKVYISNFDLDQSVIATVTVICRACKTEQILTANEWELV